MHSAPTGTALGTGLQRLVALVGEVEGGRITLAALHMEHPLLGTTALQQAVHSHYLRAALPEIVKLVGSANVLGAALFWRQSLCIMTQLTPFLSWTDGSCSTYQGGWALRRVWASVLL